ncbi:DNA topoisomerase, partial [Alteromonas sp. 14N.309.X.WAT.G.H12]|uniref:DNA topoisomerase n=1 Tax=Alteromonas sp. 14N.309.X.WAT.G.H12 TaxID=3120824 RepID=UPI002FD6B421
NNFIKGGHKETVSVMPPFNEVIICEKPAQAKMFQKALKLTKGFDIKGNRHAWYDKEGGICVFYLRGHILELLPPEHYEPKLKFGWRTDLLPVVVSGTRWPLRVSDGAESLFKAAEWALVKSGTPKTITIATDNDREGELLGWELLEHLKLADHPHLDRVFYSQVTKKKIIEAYNKKMPASKTYPRYLAGLARMYGDWSVGMNITMGLSAQNEGMIPPYTPLNAGRVVFAICYILYLRYIEMRDFRPTDYFTHKVNFLSDGGGKYSGSVSYPEKHLDPKTKKLIDKDIAEKMRVVIVKIGKGKVVRCDKVNKETAPPTGFHRTGFDRHMIRKYGMTLKDTSDALQRLYEAGYITYPRVDLKVLDETMHSDMPSYIKALIANLRKAPQLTDAEKGRYESAFKLIDLKRKTRIWKKGVDDSGSHHAIITTEESVPMANLSPNEFKVYREMADRLLIQFLPNYQYASTVIETQVAGGLLCKTTGAVPVDLGWKGVSKDMEEEEGDSVVDGCSLPALSVGQVVGVGGVEMVKQTTSSPKCYAEDELLGVLENPKKFVKNKELIKKVKKLQIGTDGTRQAHVSSLKPKGFVQFKKDGKLYRLVPLKKLVSLMEIAPDYFSTPEATAYWESSFYEIENGQQTLESFIARFRKLEARFFEDLNKGQFNLKSPVVENVKICADENEEGKTCGGNLFLVKRKSKKTKKIMEVWRCSKCRSAFFNTKNGEPGNKLAPRGTEGAGEKPKWVPPPDARKIKCTVCEKDYTYHKIIPGKDWSLWECVGCGAAFFDSKGKHGSQLKKK